MRVFVGCVTTLLLLVSGIAEPPVPQLASTSPPLWAVGIDPNQKQVSLTFDQQMSPAYTAWLGRSSLPPEVDINSTMSQDRRTLAVKVKLQAGKVYVFGLNEKSIPGVGFQNEKGLSLPPTYLVFQTVGKPTLEDTPPHVVKTMPANGAEAIDSSRLKSLAISFDAAMNTKKHGLHLFEDKQPVDISRAAFQYSPDGKTFTLAYDFKPSKIYMLELNNLHDIGFSRTTRVPLWPVQFTFSTGATQ
jgi:hypothetical protein